MRRIFRDFAAGIGPRAIAKSLNDEGIPGPHGKLWNDTTIRGYVKRGTGIINNGLYIGRLIWNRLRYVKDLSTGKRVSRLNPKSEWNRCALCSFGGLPSAIRTTTWCWKRR